MSDFELKGIIGRGHFGEVQVVTEKYTGDVYAMKIMRKVDMLSQQNVINLYLSYVNYYNSLGSNLGILFYIIR